MDIFKFLPQLPFSTCSREFMCLKFVQPTYTHKHTHPRPPTSFARVPFNSSPSSPPSFPPCFFEKAPVLAYLSIRCCPVVAVTEALGWEWRVAAVVSAWRCSYISSSLRAGFVWWLTRQVVIETADSRNTDSWFERQWHRSLYLTCHGSQSTFSINLWCLWKDGGKYCLDQHK